ncbi:MAG: tetratricopeptide repeat protein [bacterium]
MSKIVISGDKSLENLEIRLSHILPKESEIEQAKESFVSLESILNGNFTSFFPSSLVSTPKDENLPSMLSGDDELELFFLIVLSKGETKELFEKLKSLKNSINSERYSDFLLFLFLKSRDEKEAILEEIELTASYKKEGISDLILAAYSLKPHEIKLSKGPEYLYATFFEALKAEKSGDYSRAFSLMTTLFKASGFHPFIFEILKFYMVEYREIPLEQVEVFLNNVVESSLFTSFSDLKFIEFLYYYRNNIEEKLDETVAALAESTNSTFILNVIVPLLYKYQKWHLVGKYYKLSAKKTVGPERTKYLELLADIYENKLNMPEFAVEIHKSIVEEDPINCSVSFSKVLSVYEENKMWSELFNLYNHLSGREEDKSLKAYYLYKAGEILHRELRKSSEAKEFLEKSLSLKHSFEVVRTLSEIYLNMRDYDSYIKTLLTELEFSTEEEEKIRVLNIIAETYINHKKDLLSGQKYLLKILEIAKEHLPTIKKLGKIYYKTKNWQKLTEINFKEIDLSKDLIDIVNLYYRNGSIFFKELVDFDRATECFMEILEIKPDHIPSLLYLEKIYLHNRDLNNLTALYRLLLDQSSGDSETNLYYLTRLGIVYRDSNMTDKAIDVFEEVLKSSPESIMAKENLRMLKGIPDFTDSNTGGYIEKDIELFYDLVRDKDHSAITEQYLMKKELSFWKYLYFNKKDSEIKVEKPSGLNPDEEFIVSILERDYSIDTLIKNSSKKVALMLLLEKYLDEKCYLGVQTILEYYLKLEPESKRKMWSIFFKGYGNPELKEELEHVLLSDESEIHVNIVRELLEKIYLKEKDYNTILFLRNLFIKKVTDAKEKCFLIDSTIALLQEYIEVEPLLELYKLRFASTPEDELCAYSEIYESFLKSIGKTDLLSEVYELKWNKDKDICAAKKSFELHSQTGNIQKAVEMGKHVLAAEWELPLFVKLIELLKNNGNIDLAINDVTSQIEKTEDEEKEQLKTLLLELNLEAGYTHNALDLFNKTFYHDNVERFEQGMKLAELMSQSKTDENSILLVNSLIPPDSGKAAEKIKFFLNANCKLSERDLYPFHSYKEMFDAFDGSLPKEYVEMILTYFSNRGDSDAKEALVDAYIKKGDEESASKLIDSMSPNSFSKALFLSKIAFSQGETEKEKKILKEILFAAIENREPYPIERLLVLEKENRRLAFFLESVLKMFGLEIESELFPRIIALGQKEIFEFLNFTQKELFLHEYLHITSFGEKDEVKTGKKPLNSSRHRNLISLIEYIKLSAGFDDLTGFFDEELEVPFEVLSTRLPSICFGPSSLKMSVDDLKFKTAQNSFLLFYGVRNIEEISGTSLFVDSVLANLALEGKEKVKFIKNVRASFQNRLLKIVEILKDVDSKTVVAFADKLSEASFYHAFSLVPDIKEVLDFTDCTLEEFASKEEKTAKAVEFIYKFIL